MPLNEPKTILKLNGMWLIHIFILLSYLNNITILQYICNNTKTHVMFLFLLPLNCRILYITVYFYIYFWSLFFCSCSGPRWVNKAAANLFCLHVAFIGFKFQTLLFVFSWWTICGNQSVSTPWIVHKNVSTFVLNWYQFMNPSSFYLELSGW